MDPETGHVDGAWLARAQGTCNVLGGIWPLVHMSSFEKVFGVKVDRWLVRTVAGLLVGIGYSQIRASRSPEGVRHARRIGLATASTLLSVDLVYVPARRIRPTYLLDALAEAGWIYAWRRSAGRPPTRAAGQRLRPARRPRRAVRPPDEARACLRGGDRPFLRLSDTHTGHARV